MKKEHEITEMENQIEVLKKDLRSKTKGMDKETLKLNIEHEKLKDQMESKQKQLKDYDEKEEIYKDSFNKLSELTPVLMDAMKCPISYVRGGVTSVNDFNHNNVDLFLKAMDKRAAQ